MSQWTVERMQLLYEVQQAAQDLLNLKDANTDVQRHQQALAWENLARAVRRVVEHSRQG